MPRPAQNASNLESKRVNKSGWIRSQDRSIPAKELVVLEKVQGIVLSVAQVYTARNTATKKNASPTLRRSSRFASEEFSQFRRLVLALGVIKADAYLSELKRSLGL